MGDGQLDARLAADTHPVGELRGIELRLMDDARWPWLVLVPRQPGARELVDLDEDAQVRLLDAIGRCSRALQRIAAPDKLNVAALGNVVEQLHVHVVARRRDDPAWPRPVWDHGERVPYADDARDALVRTLRDALAP